MCPDHGNACRQVDGSIKKYGGRAPFSDMSSSTNMWVSNASWLHICVLHLYSDNCIACSQSACNWRQTDVDPEDLKRWRERAQSANKLQFLMMSGKHVARGVTKPTGRKKGKCATMRTWTLGGSLVPMITCPPKYQVLPTNLFSALDPLVVS